MTWNNLYSPTHARGDIDVKKVKRAADWHGAMAVKAYRARDYKTYTRHIRIADKLWGSK